MQKMWLALGSAFLVIIACMIYLVVRGVGLRSAPLIKPSVIEPNGANVASDVMLRLYPEFKNAHYVVWGVLPETPESTRLMSQMLSEYEKIHHAPAHMIVRALEAGEDELKACGEPCWLLLPTEKANELSPGSFAETKLKPLGRPYFSITWLEFSGDEVVPEHCEQEKRISFDCIKPLAVREVRRKLKDPSVSYFFMRKYNEIDNFVFFQKRGN